MKQAGQYLAAFLLLLGLYEVVDYLGGGQFLKILPICYVTTFFLAGLRAALCLVLIVLRVLVLSVNAHYGVEDRDPLPNWNALQDCVSSNFCLMAASVLAQTQTRPWAFCGYVVVAYILLGIGDEAFKRSREDPNESS